MTILARNSRTATEGRAMAGWMLAILLLLGAALAASAAPPSLPFSDGFEGYAVGTPLTNLDANGWGASSNSVVVENTVAASGPNAVLLPGDTTLTNTVDSTGQRRVWTDVQVQPIFGSAPADAAGPDQSVRAYVDTNGYLLVQTAGGGWLSCTNDAWGTSVSPVASGAWLRVTFFTDYNLNQAAVFLNGRLLCQQVPFVGGLATNYIGLIAQNRDEENNFYLDSVSAGTNVPAALTNDWDNDGMSDAAEIQQYGNVTSYHRPVITVTATNVNGPAISFGSVVPGGTFDVFPGSATNFSMTANPAFIATAIKLNGQAAAFTGQNTRYAAFNYNNIVSDTVVSVEFTYTGIRYVTNDYATIEAALAAVLSNETLVVADGAYNLSTSAAVRVPLTIVGNTNVPGNVTVNAPSGGVDRDCFQVRAPNVTIQGFRLTGALNYPDPTSNGWLNAGIMVGNATNYAQMATNAAYLALTNLTFAYDEMSNCSYGVYLYNATNALVGMGGIAGNVTGVWANAAADARLNWWGSPIGPSGVGSGNGDSVSSNVLFQPWWANAAKTQRGFSVPAGGDLQSVLNQAGSGDLVNIAAGTYNSNIVFGTGVAVTGGAFVLNGNCQVSNNVQITWSTNVACASNLTVAAGSVLFVNGAILTSSHLVVQAGGTVVVSNGTVTADGLTMSGTFTLNSNWAQGLVPSSLPFIDDFEVYGPNTPVSSLGPWGWSGSAEVAVQNTTVHGGSQAIVAPDACTLSNVVAPSAATRVWTDLYMIPAPGELPTTPANTGENFRCAFTTNGYLAVDSGTGWVECVSNFVGGAVTPVSNAWVRLSVFTDYGASRAAVFVDGVLVRQRIPFLGTNAPCYTGFTVSSPIQGANQYVDDVKLMSTVPPGLDKDLDQDNRSDALELQLYGDAIGPAWHGAIFNIR